MTPLALQNLKASPGARRSRRRVGRGNGSRGTYSGRGAKGQRSRTGGRRGIIRRSIRSLLERVPKQRGFRSMHAKYAVVDVRDLDRVFGSGEVVTPSVLVRRGLIETERNGVKVLGDGTVTKALTVRAQAFSGSARAALEGAGGTVVVLERQAPAPKPKTSPPEP